MDTQEPRNSSIAQPNVSVHKRGIVPSEAFREEMHATQDVETSIPVAPVESRPVALPVPSTVPIPPVPRLVIEQTFSLEWFLYGVLILAGLTIFATYPTGNLQSAVRYCGYSTGFITALAAIFMLRARSRSFVKLCLQIMLLLYVLSAILLVREIWTDTLNSILSYAPVGIVTNIGFFIWTIAVFKDVNGSM